MPPEQGELFVIANGEVTPLCESCRRRLSGAEVWFTTGEPRDDTATCFDVCVECAELAAEL